MRTTVDIPEPTYRKLKSKAAQQGSSVKELILRGVERELRTGAAKKGRIPLPIVHSKQPGTLRLTSEQIYEIIPFP
jgi:hypothetical protein